VLLEPAARGFAIRAYTREHGVPLGLASARGGDTDANGGTRFLVPHLPKGRERNRADAHVQVNAIGQWAGKARAVARDFGGSAATAAGWFAVVSAGAWVGGADEEESCREGDALRRADDCHAGILERLAHRVEDVSRKLE